MLRLAAGDDVMAARPKLELPACLCDADFLICAEVLTFNLHQL